MLLSNHIIPKKVLIILRKLNIGEKRDEIRLELNVYGTAIDMLLLNEYVL